MTTHAPTYTPRFRFKYVSAGFEHHIQFRCARDANLATTVSGIADTLSTMGTLLAELMPEDFAWVSCEVAHQDSELFNPEPTLPTQPTGENALSLYTPLMRGTATVFKGRGIGAKVSAQLFGLFWDFSDVAGPAANGKVDGGESSPIHGAINALNGNAAITNIVGASPFWYDYATVKQNDHYVKLARRLFP